MSNGSTRHAPLSSSSHLPQEMSLSPFLIRHVVARAGERSRLASLTVSPGQNAPVPFSPNEGILVEKVIGAGHTGGHRPARLPAAS